METGSRGTFVISWSQTEIDGFPSASPEALAAGAIWRWRGEALRVDGAGDILYLEGAAGAEDMRRRAARMVRRLIGAALKAPPGKGAEALSAVDADLSHDMAEQGFVVTDGRNTYAVTLIDVPGTGARICMFLGAAPPRERDLWVVRACITPLAAQPDTGGVICFAPATRIATPDGPRPIEALRPGDRILTRDNGPQPVLWTGYRRMSGARLYAMPHLRPIRFRSGALGQGRPEGDLLVSPQHRMMVKGPAARALFNTSEVLVAAQDLIDNRAVLVDTALREITYIHLLLERHEVIWANGLETESFHPAEASLDSIDPDQRAGLLQLLPGLEADPTSYGAPARRNLTATEAAILRHEAA